MSDREVAAARVAHGADDPLLADQARVHLSTPRHALLIAERPDRWVDDVEVACASVGEQRLIGDLASGIDVHRTRHRHRIAQE